MGKKDFKQSAHAPTNQSRHNVINLLNNDRAANKEGATKKAFKAKSQFAGGVHAGTGAALNADVRTIRKTAAASKIAKSKERTARSSAEAKEKNADAMAEKEDGDRRRRETQMLEYDSQISQEEAAAAKKRLKNSASDADASDKPPTLPLNPVTSFAGPCSCLTHGPNHCAFTTFCPCIALGNAHAAYALPGGFCTGCMCGCAPPVQTCLRRKMATAHGIESGCAKDVVVPCVCCYCSQTSLLQTAKKGGRRGPLEPFKAPVKTDMVRLDINVDPGERGPGDGLQEVRQAHTLSTHTLSTHTKHTH